MKRVSREIKILKKVRHHNVIQLMEVIDAPKQIFLVMELTDSGEVRRSHWHPTYSHRAVAAASLDMLMCSCSSTLSGNGACGSLMLRACSMTLWTAWTTYTQWASFTGT